MLARLVAAYHLDIVQDLEFDGRGRAAHHQIGVRDRERLAFVELVRVAIDEAILRTLFLLL